MKREPQRTNSLERVQLYLDAEMNADEERIFLHEVKGDANLKATLEDEKHLRDRLRDVVSRNKPSARLVQAIKEKIRIAPV